MNGKTPPGPGGVFFSAYNFLLVAPLGAAAIAGASRAHALLGCGMSAAHRPAIHARPRGAADAILRALPLPAPPRATSILLLAELLPPPEAILALLALLVLLP
jgi:uncharacterized protein YbjT (DUF2867 family)